MNESRQAGWLRQRWNLNLQNSNSCSYSRCSRLSRCVSCISSRAQESGNERP